jgi:hypothetical protein
VPRSRSSPSRASSSSSPGTCSAASVTIASPSDPGRQEAPRSRTRHRLTAQDTRPTTARANAQGAPRDRAHHARRGGRNVPSLRLGPQDDSGRGRHQWGATLMALEGHDARRSSMPQRSALHHGVDRVRQRGYPLDVFIRIREQSPWWTCGEQAAQSGSDRPVWEVMTFGERAWADLP